MTDTKLVALGAAVEELSNWVKQDALATIVKALDQLVSSRA